MQPFTISRHGKHTGLHLSQWPTFIMLHGCLHWPYKPVLLVLHLSSPITAKCWWSSLVLTVIQWCFHAYFDLVSVVRKRCLFIYFLIRRKWCTLTVSSSGWLVRCWSQTQAFIGSPLPLLLCRGCHFDSFLGWGPYTVWVCLSTDPETSGYIIISDPQLF